jgi:hypothetical protein
VGLSCRFCLSDRDVEALLAARGVILTEAGPARPAPGQRVAWAGVVLALLVGAWATVKIFRTALATAPVRSHI